MYLIQEVTWIFVRDCFNRGNHMKLSSQNNKWWYATYCKMHKEKYIPFTIFFLLCTVCNNAQNIPQLSGFIFNVDKEPISYCTISVLAEKDSSLVIGCVSDENGYFEIDSLSFGQYILKYNHLQYQTSCENIPFKRSYKISEIVLQSAAINLDEVVVKGSLIAQRPNGFIVDIAHNPFAENKNVTETFALLPGVTVNNDELKINGNPVAKILIDGKEVTDRNELLSIRSDMIDKIEIINNADSRHHASVIGGVIHIKLKKLADGNYRITFGGNISADKNVLGKSLAYMVARFRYKKWSFINNLQYMNFKYPSKNKYEKTYSLIDKCIYTDSKEIPKENSVYDKLSIAYDINDNHNIGVSFNTRISRRDLFNYSNSEITSQKRMNRSEYIADGTVNTDRYQTSLNYNWKIDDQGSNLAVVADYIKNKVSNNNLNSSIYYESDSTVSTDQRFRIHTPLDLVKIEANLSLNLSSKSLLEAGGDFYSRKTLQEMSYENKERSGWVMDDNLSDLYGYKGSGFGLYAGYSLTLKNITFNPSLRLQLDWVETHPYRAGVNKRDYWNLFPNLLLSYYVNDKIKMDAFYRRGMSDIKYGYMNPKIIYDTDYSYSKGNPDLNPSRYDWFDVKWRFFKKWSVGYTLLSNKHLERLFTYIDDQNPSVTYIMPTNMDHSLSQLVSLGYSSLIVNWWYVNIFTNYRWQNFEYDQYSHSTSNFSYSLYNSFDFGHDFRGYLSFNGETKIRSGETIYLPVFYSGIGVSKSFFKDKLSISLDFDNIVSKRRRLETVKDDGSFRSMNWNKSEALYVNLSIVYTISGGGKKQSTRTVKTIQTVQDDAIKE